MIRIDQELDGVAVLAKTISQLHPEDLREWYSIYGAELVCSVEDARLAVKREASYVASLIKASMEATNAVEQTNLLALAIKTLEGNNGSN